MRNRTHKYEWKMVTAPEVLTIWYVWLLYVYSNNQQWKLVIIISYWGNKCIHCNSGVCFTKLQRRCETWIWLWCVSYFSISFTRIKEVYQEKTKNSKCKRYIILVTYEKTAIKSVWLSGKGNIEKKMENDIGNAVESPLNSFKNN